MILVPVMLSNVFIIPLNWLSVPSSPVFPGLVVLRSKSMLRVNLGIMENPPLTCKYELMGVEKSIPIPVVPAVTPTSKL